MRELDRLSIWMSVVVAPASSFICGNRQKKRAEFYLFSKTLLSGVDQRHLTIELPPKYRI
jgi:hypothetical protein